MSPGNMQCSFWWRLIVVLFWLNSVYSQSTNSPAYSVRLVNGPSPSEGRVEILYNGQWNTICDDYWHLEEAQVVCRQLGYATSNVTPRSSAYYGQGSGSIRQVQCSGSEYTLASCTLSSGDYICSHSEDAGVNCEETYSVRLVNGPSPSEGRVEILYNGEWNTICDDFWNLEEAQVVCRQLGYSTDNVVARSSAYYGQGSGPIRLVQCSGLENTLKSCTLSSGDYTCRHYEDAGVRCGIDISTTAVYPFQWSTSTRSYYDGIYNVRLVNGPSPNEGRVEILYIDQWYTICDDSWNLEEAQVVCRQLGYSDDNVVARSSAYYGQGSGSIQLVTCYGWEYTLDHCSLSSGDSICGHYEDAGVRCGDPTTSGTSGASPRVIGSMSFVGVSLFLLTIIAIVAVVFVCNQQKISPSAAMGMQQLTTLTTNPAPQPASTMPMPAPVCVDVPV